MGRQLTTGQAAPDFNATAHDGRTLWLSRLLESGPVVLVLIRGFG